MIHTIHFSDAPYCEGHSNKRIVVARNSTVTLHCTVEAQPEVTAYNWVNARPGLSDRDIRPADEHKGPSLGNGPSLTLVPNTDSTQIVCYAKNREGYSQVPCVYTIVVVGEYDSRNCILNFIIMSF